MDKVRAVMAALISSLLTSCVAIPKKAVRVEDRLWLEKDYDRRLNLLRIDFRIERILTRFGHTQVLISGEANDKTIILLHAMGLNLTSWAPNIETLSRHYKVIAIDMIGDQGRSIVRRDYPENITEYSQLLNDIVDYFEINEVNIIGCSMGGWIGHGYAIEYPEKIQHLILISPAAGIPQKTKWMGILLKMLLTKDETKLKEASRRLLGPYQASEDWLEYMAKASKDPKGAKLGMPKEFSDEQLAKTGGKVLLLIGDSEYLYKSTDEVVNRARKTIPNITTKIIPNAGHLGAWDNPEFVNSEIISFIGIE